MQSVLVWYCTRSWRLCSSSHLSSTEPNFTLALESIVSPQMTSEHTELACRVTNIAHLPPGGRLGVNWEHTSLPGNLITPSITDGNGCGTLELVGSNLSNNMQGQAVTLRRRIALAPWTARATCCQGRCIPTGWGAAWSLSAEPSPTPSNFSFSKHR